MKNREHYFELAKLLEYPTTNYKSEAKTVLKNIENQFPELSENIKNFNDFLESQSISGIEEYGTGSV